MSELLLFSWRSLRILRFRCIHGYPVVSRVSSVSPWVELVRIFAGDWILLAWNCNLPIPKTRPPHALTS
jgi:hypothetical protein